MKFTKKTLELMKKFSSGVSCPYWDEDTVDKTMFYPQCKIIAQRMGKEEIDEEVAREFLLKVHNKFTCRIGIMAKEGIKSIKNCMVRPKKVGDNWICVHGKNEVMSISQNEAEFLERESEILLKSLQ